MIRFAVPAAIAALALAGTTAAYAQTVMPQPLLPAQPGAEVNATSAPAEFQPAAPAVAQPSAYNYNTSAYDYYGDKGTGPTALYNGAPAYAAPQAAQPGYPSMMPGVTPRTVWIPGAYNWDPTRQTYTWIEGQWVEAPTAAAQWVPGHWAETPSSWIWVDGRWN